MLRAAERADEDGTVALTRCPLGLEAPEDARVEPDAQVLGRHAGSAKALDEVRKRRQHEIERAQLRKGRGLGRDLADDQGPPASKAAQ